MVLILVWMLLFSIVHSITADKRFKMAIARRFGQRLYEGFYRLGYNALSVVLLMPPALHLLSMSHVVYRVPGWLAPVFVVLQAIGALGLLVSLLQIDVLRFAGLRQAIAYFRGTPLPLPKEPLQTGGIYGWVRHPLYFFSLLAIWFLPVMTATMLMFNAAATAYFLIGSRIEEHRMLAVYGDVYADYQRRVPWLLPIPRPRS